MKKYVIIGNGIAAAGCIEGIRSVDCEGEITVVSEEKHAVLPSAYLILPRGQNGAFTHELPRRGFL